MTTVGPHYCEGRSVNPMAEPAPLGLSAASGTEAGNEQP